MVLCPCGRSAAIEGRERARNAAMVYAHGPWIHPRRGQIQFRADALRGGQLQQSVCAFVRLASWLEPAPI